MTLRKISPSSVYGMSAADRDEVRPAVLQLLFAPRTWEELVVCVSGVARPAASDLSAEEAARVHRVSARIAEMVAAAEIIRDPAMNPREDVYRLRRAAVDLGGRALPEGWSVCEGLGMLVHLVVPGSDVEGVRRRARRRGVTLGPSRSASVDGRRRSLEVAAADVRLLLPDQQGEARHRAGDEVAGHEPSVEDAEDGS